MRVLASALLALPAVALSACGAGGDPAPVAEAPDYDEWVRAFQDPVRQEEA